MPTNNNYRAAVVNAKVKNGDNVLITGIGGGVALLAMQICIARGASVYVTSGSEDKIRKAVSLGAKGGVNYRAGMIFCSCDSMMISGPTSLQSL